MKCISTSLTRSTRLRFEAKGGRKMQILFEDGGKLTGVHRIRVDVNGTLYVDEIFTVPIDEVYSIEEGE